MLLLVVSLLAICQLVLCLNSYRAESEGASGEGAATASSERDALSLAWAVVNGTATRTGSAAVLPADVESELEAIANQSVRVLVGEGALNSLWVAGLALLVILGLGIPIGILRGRSRRNPLAWLLVFPFAVGVCLPVYWLSALLEWWMLDQRGLLLPSGRVESFDVVVEGASPWLVQAWPGILLSLVIGVTGAAWLMRSVSCSLQHSAAADHLWVGRMRGMRESQLFYRHTLRNSLRPVVMGIADLLPFVLGAAILAEGVFGFQGLGGLIFAAGLERDFAVLLAGSFLLAVLVLVARVLGEIFLGWVDPHVRAEGGAVT